MSANSISNVKWGAIEVLAPGVLGAGQWTATLSPDAGMCSILFDTARVELQGDAPLSGSWVGTFHLPLIPETKGSGARVQQELRYFVTKPKNARVLIVANFDGKTHLIEEPYGEAVEGDFINRFTQKIPPRSVDDWTAGIVIVVERLTKEDNVIVSVDSLDVADMKGRASK